LFSVAAALENNVDNFYFFFWSLARLLRRVDSGSSEAVPQNSKFRGGISLTDDDWERVN
jgi:hypothetical protein